MAGKQHNTNPVLLSELPDCAISLEVVVLFVTVLDAGLPFGLRLNFLIPHCCKNKAYKYKMYNSRKIV